MDDTQTFFQVDNTDTLVFRGDQMTPRLSFWDDDQDFRCKCKNNQDAKRNYSSCNFFCSLTGWLLGWNSSGVLALTHCRCTHAHASIVCSVCKKVLVFLLGALFYVHNTKSYSISPTSIVLYSPILILHYFSQAWLESWAFSLRRSKYRTCKPGRCIAKGEEGMVKGLRVEAGK